MFNKTKNNVTNLKENTVCNYKCIFSFHRPQSFISLAVVVIEKYEHNNTNMCLLFSNSKLQRIFN